MKSINQEASVNHHYDVRERLWSAVLFAVISAGPTFIVGCTLGFPSAILPDPLLDLDTGQSDLFGALAPLGAPVGSLIGGCLADLWGRKATLLIVAIPYLMGYLSITYSQFVSGTNLMVVLYTGRFFTGIGLGWSCLAVPVYLAEISSAKVRGLICSFTQLSLSIGLMCVYLLSSVNKMHYYDISLIIISVMVVFEILILLIPESPRWLIANKMVPSAKHSLKMLRGPLHNIENEIQIIDRDLLERPHVNFFKKLSSLFCIKNNVLSLVTVLCVMSLQQLSGLGARSAYAAVIFKDAKVHNPSETASYSIGAVGIIFTLISIFFVDSLGRKVLLFCSGVGMLIGTVALGTHFYITRPEACLNQTLQIVENFSCNAQFAPLAITSLILFTAAFSIGWGPIPWILLGELLPMNVRGVGSAMANAVNWGTAALVTGVYFKYSELVHTWFAWWTFSCFNLMGIIFVLVFVPETKKHILETIRVKH